MLTHMLRGLVNSLSRPNHLTLGLKKLGIQHLAYGVGPEHYPIVKEVLLDTISEILADSFTPELRMAWDQLLNDITFAMNPANS